MALPSKIRPATKADVELLKQIYKECRAELGSFNLYQCWDHYLAQLNNEKFDVLESTVTMLGKKRPLQAVGFVRWGWSPKYQSNVIKDIGVLRSEHGKGYGAVLARHVPCPVMLKCNEDNRQGNTFYENIGMRKAGRAFTKSGKPQTIWTCVEW